MNFYFFVISRKVRNGYHHHLVTLQPLNNKTDLENKQGVMAKI